MKYCRIFFCLVACLFLAVVGILIWMAWQVDNQERLLTPDRRELVSRLQLTDLAIWTEARYTRHPSQADLFTPFQNFPGAMEHFPAGSLLAPPFLNLSSRLEVVPKSGIDP